MEILDINIKEFDIKKISFDKKNDNNYNVKYEGSNFNIITEATYNTYGSKVNSNVKKIILLFDDYEEHEALKKVVDLIYNEFSNYLDKSNKYKNKSKLLEIINPLGTRKYSLDLEIRESLQNSTNLMEVDNNLKIISTINFESIKNSKPFTILPIICISNIGISNNKAYFNYVIREGYIKFKKPILQENKVYEVFKRFEKLNID
jgi:hypothetical protein